MAFMTWHLTVVVEDPIILSDLQAPPPKLVLKKATFPYLQKV